MTFNIVDSDRGNVRLTGTNGINADSVSAGTTALADGDITLVTTGGSVNIDDVTAAGDTVTIKSAVAIEERGIDLAADIVANRIQLIAVGGIGNMAQLEINGTTLAATTTTGEIRLQDTAGGIIVGSITTTTSTTSGLNITGGTVNDHLTLLSEGFISVNNAVNNAGAGNVLLAASASSDVVINATVRSGTGHITITAGDDIDQNADILTTGGSIFVLAANGTLDDPIRGIYMAEGTRTSTGNGNTDGNIQLVATGESDVKLGLLEAGNGSVSIEAERDILDNNDQTTAGTLNVTAAALRMIADSNSDDSGIIGGSDTGNGTPATNRNAIDTSVTTLAARSATGIYVQESNAISVNNTGDISISKCKRTAQRPR